jgi:tetratricopeptide (TPR) repeat protein
LKGEIQRLFSAALDLPEDQRVQYLAAQTSDAAVRDEVLSLLVHEKLAEPFFEATLQSAAMSVQHAMDLHPGARLGSYTIQRTLGRGGMGSVYLATRADGAFEQSVAIKVVHASNSIPYLRERFRQERQILARLSHPNIARLLDGGETATGLLYFVLEYVAGQNIEQYCEAHNLALRARLELFLQVCAGVHYAHENLVIHRDLKPGNVLVGEDGTPKLLDFGVAKVLEPISTSLGEPSTRLFTLEFASPEQIQGGAITTASDVYSLGAVLYQLLTGSRLRMLEGLSPMEVVHIISEERAPVAEGVPPEISAILQKALHIDPARRYRSAHDLAEDIGRFLAGLPVDAVPDSMGYRARTFFRRNWIPAGAVLAVALALTGGAGVAFWQARRAERRFAEVRQLSNRFLFQFEDAIHNLSGATPARKLVVATAQEYLDRLAVDAGHDRDLVRELAAAYRKLGDVQGSSIEGNTGDTKAALVSYRKALELEDSIGDASAATARARAGYLEALTALANAEAVSGDASRALPLSQRAASVADAWIQLGTKDVDLLILAGNAHSQLSAHQRENGLFEKAISSAKESLALKQRARELRPGDPKLLRAVATGYWAIGSAEKTAGHPEEATANFATTVELFRQLASANPGLANRRELLAASWLLAASTKDLLHKQKKGQESVLPLFEEAWRAGTQLLSEDPANALVEADVTSTALGLGTTLLELHRPQDALKVFAIATATQERRYKADPGNRTAAYYLELLYIWSADSNKELHDLPAALRLRRAALAILDRLVAESSENFNYRMEKASDLKEIGDLLAAQGNFAEARAKYREGLDVAEHLPKGPSLGDPASLIAKLQAAAEQVARK